MPNRILREGILTSERIASLNWAGEVFYRRVMSVVDDYGRYYATPMLLRAACYPLHLDKVSDSDIEKWLTNCVEAALVRVYLASDGKSYLELLDFRQQQRAKESKYPDPPSDAKQVHSKCVADAHLDEVVDGDVDDNSSPSGSRCPVQKIIDLYNETANHLPTCRVASELMRKNISARWKDDERFQTLEFWKGFFDYCETNEFLSGRGSVSGDREKPFRASLDWVVRPTNFAKIVNENYDRT